jgi:hypothetical protein
MRGFFEWWAGLNTWFKVSVALVLILVSTVLWLADRFWPWGWVTGVILLLFSFPNEAQKRGYHDF